MHCPTARGGQRRERWASPAVGGHFACVGARDEQQAEEPATSPSPDKAAGEPVPTGEQLLELTQRPPRWGKELKGVTRNVN